MVAQYLLPDAGITFEQLGKIADWHSGYVVWEFPAFVWLMDHGVHITDYDDFAYDAWVKDGVEGLKRLLPAKEFAWYRDNTYDLDEVTKHIPKTFAHPNFTFLNRKPTWKDVVAEYGKPGICDIVLNLRALNREEGFAAHRVVLVEVTGDEVIFHDPNRDATGAYRREPLDHFRHAFESFETPALTRYSLE
jgi:hypothetical protein